MTSTIMDQFNNPSKNIQDLEEKLTLAVEKVEEMRILVRAMEASHAQNQKILKSKIMMLEDFKKEYVIVSKQNAFHQKASMIEEIADLQSKLAKATTENEEFRDDFTITTQINENVVSETFAESICSLKNISNLNYPQNVLLSQEISFVGKWRLILYRNTNGIFCMIVIMTKGISGMYQFKIELIHHDQSRTLTVQDEEYFRIMWPSNSIKFLEHSKILKNGYYDQKTDSLHIKFSVRSSPNETLNSFMMVERCSSHKIEVKNFKELLDLNVINYCTFYDEQGFCWKLLLKRNNFFEKEGEDYFSAYLYLLNGMFNVSYDVVIEIINVDQKRNIKNCDSHVFEAPSDYLYSGCLANVSSLLDQGFLHEDDALHVNVTVSLTNAEDVDQYMPTLAKNIVHYNFKSWTKKCILSDDLSQFFDLGDELKNHWHVTVKTNDGIYYSPKVYTVKFLMFIVQMINGRQGEYEFLVELLHQNATKVICRPIRSYWSTKERYEISHFSSIDRIVNEGHIGKDNSFTLRFSVRPLRLGQRRPSIRD